MQRVRAVTFVLAFLAINAAAAAETWPARSITMVVPFAAGSASDTVGRILGARISEILGQQIIVENVGGAGGMTGVARIAKAAPDGYQIVLGGLDTFAQNQTLYKNPLYNSVADFAPVALVVQQPLVLLIRNEIPAKNLKEFIAYAKANQNHMGYGSSGVGSTSHLACAELNAAIGIDVQHVPYRGSPQAMQDLIAGRIDYFCALAAAAMPQIGSNTMKAIAVMTRDRSPVFPNLPSAHEQGLMNFESYHWNALFVPKGTSAPIIDTLHAATVAALDTPSVQERLKGVGVTVAAPDQRSPAYLKAFLSSEIAKWAMVIRSYNISLD